MASSRSSALSGTRKPLRLYGSEVPRVFTPPLRKLTPATSRGFECIEFAEDVLALELYPWQKWLLIHALEILPDDTFRFQIVVLLVARQNGKSTLMQVLSLWRMYVDGAPLIIGTAQNLDIAEEQWTAAVEMAEANPDLANEIEHVDKTNGKKTLRLTSGSRYKIATASRRGGRGLSGDLILLDELREHQKWDAWSAVTKTTMTKDKSQIWGVSNAGDFTSLVLRHLRALAHLALGDPDGVNGDDAAAATGTNDDLGLFEWSAEPGCDIWDRAGWAQGNPSMGHIPGFERKIEGFAGTDPEREFRTEVLCQWVDSMHEGAFPQGVWESQGTSDVRISTRPVVAVDVRTGMKQSASIVVAGGTEAGHDLIQVAKYELGQGKMWSESHVVDYVVEALQARKLDTIVMDGYGENGPLIPLFEARGITVIALNTRDMVNGCVGLHDGVINGRVKHLSEEPLNVAVLGARSRKSGEAWLWSRNQSVTDAGPLMAAVAAWWVYTSGASSEYDPLDSVF